MADQAPKMGKKFFGYDRASVERMLLERDAMLKVAERRVQSAEAKTAKIEERLGELERRAREAEAAAAAAAAPTATPRERAEVLNMPREKSAAHAPEELVKAVTAAEASASQIIEAWTSTRHQISEADRLWRAVQDEVVRHLLRRDVLRLRDRRCRRTARHPRRLRRGLRAPQRHRPGQADGSRLRVHRGLRRWAPHPKRARTQPDRTHRTVARRTRTGGRRRMKPARVTAGATRTPWPASCRTIKRGRETRAAPRPVRWIGSPRPRSHAESTTAPPNTSRTDTRSDRSVGQLPRILSSSR